MIVNSNIASFKVNDALYNNNNSLNNSIEKLSTEQKVIKTNNDSSIAEKLKSGVSSVNKSVDTSISAVAMLQITDRALVDQAHILDSIRTQLMQAKAANKEGGATVITDINRLLYQLNNIASRTNYNGTYLLQNGSDDISAVEELSFKLGDIAGETIEIDTNDIQSNSEGLGLNSLREYEKDTDLTPDVIDEELKKVDDALIKLNSYRVEYGLTQKKVGVSTKDMVSSTASSKDVEAIARDVKLSDETSKLIHDNVLEKNGKYVMSQANSEPKHVQFLLS